MFQFFTSVIYVKLQPDMLVIRDAGSGREMAEPPLVAISRGEPKRVLAIGKDAASIASMQAADLLNPFKHPRTLVSDFTTEEQVLKHFVRQVSGRSLGGIFKPAPVIVLHPQIDPEGGFTQIEIRALHEMAIGAGGRRVVIWQGRELGDDELLGLKFESGGQVLN